MKKEENAGTVTRTLRGLIIRVNCASTVVLEHCKKRHFLNVLCVFTYYPIEPQSTIFLNIVR